MKVDRASITVSPEDTEISTALEELIAIHHKELKNLEFSVVKSPGKAHIIHWADVLDHFDEVLELATSDIPEEREKYTRKQVLAVLERTTFLLRETIIHIEYYNSFERIEKLLLSEDIEIVCAALQLLLPFTSTMSVPFADTLKSIAFPLTRKQPIPLVDMLTENISEETLIRGSIVAYDYLSTDNTKVSIFIPEVHKIPLTPQEILNSLIKKYDVPQSLQFPLLHRIRFAKEFRDAKLRCTHAIAQLYALAFGNLHKVVRVTTVGKICAEQLFQVLPHPDISIESKIHVLRCYSRLDDSHMSHYIIKRGCSPQGLIPSCMRTFISMASSGSPDSERAEDLLVGLLANIYTYTFHDRKLLLASSGMVSLLSFLLSHDHPKVFCFSLEILTNMMKTNHRVLYSVINNTHGIEGLYKYTRLEGNKFTEWLNDPKNSILTLSHKKLTVDQQTPTTLLDALSAMLRSNVRSSSSRKMVCQFIKHGVANLISPILLRHERFHCDLYNSALHLLSDMIQIEPENYSLIAEHGLCSAAIKSILGCTDIPTRCFITCCRVIRHISLNENGRKEIIQSGVLRSLLSILFVEETVDKQKVKVIEAITCSAETLCELVNHYRSDYKDVIANECIACIERFLLFREEKKKEVTLPRPPQEPLPYSQKSDTPCKISVAKFAFFSSALYEYHSIFSLEQIKIWIQASIPIFISYLPDNVSATDRCCTRFLTRLKEEHVSIMLNTFIQLIKERYQRCFGNDIHKTIFDPTNKDQISTCYLMNYFIIVLENLDNTRPQDVKEIFESEDFKDALRMFLDVHRCILWHSSEQDVKKIEYDYQRKTNPNSMKNLKEPTITQRMNKIDPNSYVFDCFYMRPDAVTARAALEIIAEDFEKIRTLEAQSVTLLFQWAKENRFCENPDPIVMAKYISRALSYFRTYVLTDGSQNYTKRKLLAIESSFGICNILDFAYSVLLEPSKAIPYQIISDPSHALRPVSLDVAGHCVLQFIVWCNSMVQQLHPLSCFDSGCTLWKQFIQRIQVIMDPFWKPNQMTNFPPKVVEAFISLHHSITDPPKDRIPLSFRRSVCPYYPRDRIPPSERFAILREGANSFLHGVRRPTDEEQREFSRAYASSVGIPIDENQARQAARARQAAQARHIAQAAQEAYGATRAQAPPNTPPTSNSPTVETLPIFSIVECMLGSKNLDTENFLNLINPKKSNEKDNTKLFIEHAESIFVNTCISVSEQYAANVFRCLRTLSGKSNVSRQIIYDKLHGNILSHCEKVMEEKKSYNWIAPAISLISSFFILPEDHDMKPDSPTPRICLLSDNDCIRWLRFCLQILQDDNFTSQSPLIVSAVNLLAKVVIYQDLASEFMKQNGLNILFRLSIQNTQQGEIVIAIQSLLRHITETSAVLQVAMENEICFLLKVMNRGLKPKEFLQIFSHLALRDKDVFFKATVNCCQLKGDRLVAYSKSSNEFFSPTSNDAESSSKESTNITEPKIHTRRLKVPQKASLNSSKQILRFLFQSLTNENETLKEEEQPNEKPENINESKSTPTVTEASVSMDIDSPAKDTPITKEPIASQTCIMACIADLVTNFPHCSQILLDSSPVESKSTTTSPLIYFLLKHVVKFPVEAVTTTTWTAKDSDACLLGARLIVVLWGTKEGRKKILYEISRILKEISDACGSPLVPCSIHQICSIYALSELMKILLKLRKSKEHNETLATLCLKAQCVSSLMNVLSHFDLNLTHYFHVTESITQSLALVTHLILKYHSPVSSQPTSSPHQQSLTATPSNHSPTQPQGHTDSAVDLLSYMESVTDDLPVDDDDDEDMDDTPSDSEAHDEQIINEPGEGDDEDEDENNDDDDTEEQEMIQFSDSDWEENPVIPGFFYGGFNDNPTGILQIRSLLNRRIRARRERITRELTPLRNVSRPDPPVIPIFPSVQHQIRKIFGHSIPNLLVKRWNRWIDHESSFTAAIINYSLSLNEEFMKLELFGNPNKSSDDANNQSHNRPNPEDEPPRKRENTQSLRGSNPNLYLDFDHTPPTPTPNPLVGSREISWNLDAPSSSDYQIHTPTIDGYPFDETRTPVFNNVPDSSVLSSPAAPSQPPEAPTLDMDVLNELPDDIRQEILENRQTVERLINRPTELPDGINREYFYALPAELQAEILSDASNHRAPPQQARSVYSPPRSIPPLRLTEDSMHRAMLSFTTHDGDHSQMTVTFTEDMSVFPPLQHIPRAHFRATRLRQTLGNRIFEPIGTGDPFIRRHIELHRGNMTNRKIIKDYEGAPLVSDSDLETILRLLYWNTPKLYVQKLCRNFYRHPKTRNSLTTMLLHLLGSHRSHYQPSPTLPENISLPTQIDQLWDRLSPPYVSSSLAFSPLMDPCHPLFGLKKLVARHISLSDIIPKVVFKRTLGILLDLSTSNILKQMVEYMFSPIPDNFRELYLGLATCPSETTTIPLAVMIGVLGEKHVTNSYKNLAAVTVILSNLTKHLNEYKIDSQDSPSSSNAEASVEQNDQPTPMDIDTTENNQPTAAPEETRKSSEEPEQATEEEKIILIDCPPLSNSSIKNLLDTLQHPACVGRTLDKLVQVINRICSNIDNRSSLLKQFQCALIGFVEKEGNFLNNLLQRFSAIPEQEKQVSLFLSTCPSTHSEALLRIISCCVKIFPNTWSTTAADRECCQLWKSLISLVEIVQGFYHMESQDTQQLSISTLASLRSIIEAFFVFHHHLWPSKEKATEIEMANEATRLIFCKENILFQFIHNYHTIINCLLRESPELLNSSLEKITYFPSYLSFDIKRKHFQKLLHEEQPNTNRSRPIKIRVRRSDLFEDSFQKMRNLKPEELRQRISIQFDGEPGVDAGGLLKDWYQELSKQIFNPNYALFIHSADSTFQPNKDSSINPHHLDFFKFCGRVIGKAIFDGSQMDVHFTRSFYKHILGKSVVWADIEAVDPEYYKNLKWLLENNVSQMDLTFSVESNSFGHVTFVDLIPNGSKISVTEENKEKYVQAIADYKMTKTIESQLTAFKDGFYELIPHNLISMFNELELGLLISGLPDIDIQDMKRNTEYRGYTVDSPVIRFFWDVVMNRFTDSDRALLLQFVTGSSKVPLDGFAALQGMNGLQKFRIVRMEDTKRLPTAHTCFNQLDLPPYRTEDELERQLLTAIKETSGFGFA